MLPTIKRLEWKYIPGNSWALTTGARQMNRVTDSNRNSDASFYGSAALGDRLSVSGSISTSPISSPFAFVRNTSL